MDPRLSLVMVTVLVVPFILCGIAALGLDLSQSRRDRRERVVARWGELRITESFLIVGYDRNAPRIPLAGLSVRIAETGSPSAGPDAHLVHLTVTGDDGESVQRTQRYSDGALTAARMFEIMFNRTNTAAVAPAVEASALRWAA
ncbi:hypothetical protein [Mycolicibacterium vinylchloridicum]|jgi:hypothetical protein|uniref:hypothetical protein n=1 Tax=Mycolicibacterium vinylchloridicum TaxID=2736928 RepID=UPI0015C883BB|nr:hypothetical protein [Mycolicibacterium vinylchloridicum]